MKAYSTTIELHVDYFEAENEIDAERIVNEYIDVLAEIAPATLTWPSCDWQLVETEVVE